MRRGVGGRAESGVWVGVAERTAKADHFALAMTCTEVFQ